jgi:Zn-dependent protease
LPPLSEILPLFIVLVLSLSFHEAAHAWTADKLGDPTARMLGRLTLNPLAHIDWIGTVLFPLVALWSGLPLIGWAKPVPVNMRNLRHPRRDFAGVALAGPVSNVLLAIVGVVMLRLLPVPAVQSDGTAPLMTDFLFRFISLNVLLAVFNMLPVPPLDGGNVLAGLVPEPIARLIDQMRPYGFLILYALMFSGILFQLTSPIYRAILRALL